MGKNLLALCAVLALTVSASAAETIVAVVNGAPITARDVGIAVDRMIPQATFHGSVSEERRAEFRDKAVEELITFELQYQDGLARGLKAEAAQVKDQMKRIRDAFPTSQDYKKWLEQTSFTEDLVRQKIQRGLVVQAAVAKVVVEPSRVSDKELQEYYAQNTTKFRQPEGVRLRIISTKNEKKAREILAKLRGGDDFGNVAARMSEDDYRIKGGDIGYVHRGRIYPAIEEAAFKLKPGEMSDLIWTEQTWFVVKVEDRRPEQVVPFEQAKNKLRSELEKKRASELMDAWVSALRAKAKIELLEPSTAGSEKEKK